MKNKKILGLDIGTTSIGWAIVEATDQKRIDSKTGEEVDTATDINNDRIGIHHKDGKAAVGVRIIKQDTDSIQQFNAGQKLNTSSKSTPTANRRIKRGGRRLKSRYKLRRQKLHQILDYLGMLPDGISKIISNDGTTTYTQDKNSKYYTAQKGSRNNDDIGKAIYELRDKAIREEITLEEWGRIMLHLNQWRGYSSDRFAIAEKEETTLGTTARVSNIEKSEDYVFKRTVKKKELETIYDTFIIEFDNGEKGIVIRTKENENFDFVIGKLCTYKFKDEYEINGFKPIDKKNINENSWSFKKDKINSTIQEWCNVDGTVGSYFYQNFYVSKSDDVKRIRTNIVNRDWYEKEFDKIFELQYEKHTEHFEKLTIEDIVASAFHKTYKDGTENKAYTQILNAVNKHKIKTSEQDKDGKDIYREATKAEKIKYLIADLIIYYQRPWQQDKNKGECTFEFVPDMMPNPDYIEGVSDPKKKYVNNTKNPSKKIIKDGKEIGLKGRTVIPRSHPLHQEFKIWNQINNVKLFYHQLDEKAINLFEDSKKFIEKTGKTIEEAKDLLYKILNSGESKTASWYSFVSNKKEGLGLENVCDEIEILQAEKKGKKTQGVNTETGEVNTEYFTVNYRKRKKDGTYSNTDLKGNSTLYQINKILELEDKEWYNQKHPVSRAQDVTNLQLLWEIIYDINISDANKVSELIQKKFPSIDKEKANLLSKIKFDDSGMGQLSAKAIRNLLPLMSGGINLTTKASEKINSLIKVNGEEKALKDENKLTGLKDFFRDAKTRLILTDKKTATDFTYLSFTEASAIIYGSHSSNGIQGNFKAIETVRQHSMNNPVVEKIVNETIRVVNDIYEEYAERDVNGNLIIDENGKPKMGFDEVRIELSRELKASAEERENMADGNRNNAKRNELAKRMIKELFSEFQPNSRNITLLKIYQDEAKQLTIEEYDKLKKDGVSFENEENKTFKKFDDIVKEYKLTDPSKADITRYKLWLEQKYQCPYTGEVIKLSEIFTAKYEKEHILPKALYPLDEYSNYVITRKSINNWKGDRIARLFIEQEQGKSEPNSTDNNPIKILSLADYENHVKNLFPKGKKLNNLLRKDLPEEPISRELKDTQYINKKIKEKLSELVGNEKVHSTTGQVTDILREGWHLNEVMKSLLDERYENFKPPLGKGSSLENTREQTLKYEATNAKNEKVIVYPSYSKRLDHRHHALDAIIIACTKQTHIQALNTLYALHESKKPICDLDETKKIHYSQLRDEIFYYDENKKKKYYNTPWIAKNFIPNVHEALVDVSISHKANSKLLSPSINRLKNGKTLKTFSVRNGLHKENFIGTRKIYNNSKTPILDVIDLVFEEALKNNITIIEAIKKIVYKVKYQNQLIKLIEKLKVGSDILNAKDEIVAEINKNKDYYFQYASTFELTSIKKKEIKFVTKKEENSETDTETIDEEIDENDKTETNDNKKQKQLKGFQPSSNDRTYRYYNIRNNFYNTIAEQFKKAQDNTPEKKHLEELKKNIADINLYPILHNAIYDVRTTKGIYRAIFECKNLKKEEIEYLRFNKVTKKYEKDDAKIAEMFNLINNYQREFTIENLLIYYPIKKGNDLPIKSITVNNRLELDTLYTIPKKGNRPKTLVQLDDKYKALVLKDENGNQHFKYVEFIDAIKWKKGYALNPNNYLLRSFPICNKFIGNSKLMFEVGKGDYVVYHPTISILEKTNDERFIKENIFKVVMFETKSNYINIEKIEIADSIKLRNREDVEGINKGLKTINDDLEKLNEEKMIIVTQIITIENEIQNTNSEVINFKTELKSSANNIDKGLLKIKIIELEETVKTKKEELKGLKSKTNTIIKNIISLQTEFSKIEKNVINNNFKKAAIEEPTVLKLSIDKIFLKVYINRLGTKISTNPFY